MRYLVAERLSHESHLSDRKSHLGDHTLTDTKTKFGNEGFQKERERCEGNGFEEDHDFFFLVANIFRP